MLNAGWSKNEIIEVIIYLIGYVGFPLTLEAMKAVHEVTESNKVTA
jgi:alkylhydroperoxidase/carboxymuconolactone decarboxylase family protein YurZ